MTVNNLDDHISWLLQKRPIPPVGTSGPPSEPPVARASISRSANLANPPIPAPILENTTRPAREVPLPTLRPLGIDVIQAPIRPPVPSEFGRGQQESLGEGQRIEGGDMARLQSAPRQPKPTLLISRQLQLGTPSSTNPSSLSASYTASFQKDGKINLGPPFAPTGQTIGTPTTNIPKLPLPSRLSRTTNIPPLQTPARTPNFTSIKSKVIKTIDLTGDDELEIENGPEPEPEPEPETATSSAEQVWGESRVLWLEDAAARPSPSHGKKRKSDDISRDMPGRSKASKPPEEDSQGFVDIESLEGMDVDERPHLVKNTSVNSIPLAGIFGQIKPTIEAGSDQDFEHFTVTQTTRRIERRTVTTLSRKSSVTDAGDIIMLDQQSARSPMLSPRNPSRLNRKSPQKLDLPRKNTSPLKSPIKRSISPSLEASLRQKKLQASQRKVVIADSEEEDLVSDVDYTDAEHRGAMIINSPTKHSAIKLQQDSSPDVKCLGSLLDYVPQEREPSVPASTKPLHKSPSKEDSKPSPLQRDASTKLSRSASNIPTRLHPNSSQSVPSSTLGSDDKMLIALVLKNPSILDKHLTVIEENLKQNDIDQEEYFDNEGQIPKHLKISESLLRDQKEATKALVDIFEMHKELCHCKQKLMEEFKSKRSSRQDTTECETANAKVISDLRKLEFKLLDNLRAVGMNELKINDYINGLQRQPLSPTRPATGLNDSLKRTPRERQFSNSPHTIHETQVPPSHSRSTQQQPRFNSSRNGGDLPTPRGNFNVFAEPSSHINFQSELPDEFDDQDADDAFRSLKENPFVPRAKEIVEEDYGSDIDEEFMQVAERVERHGTSNSFQPHQSKGLKNSTSARKTPEKKAKSRTEHATFPVERIRPDMLKHPWSRELYSTLDKVFGLTGFRHNQLDAIDATLSGKDTFVLMPTGGGKSLCYQLPALINTGKTQGTTVVISPLISLMEDQVAHLEQREIQACLLNGDTASEFKIAIMKSLRDPKVDQYIRLLYVTPEMLIKNQNLVDALSTTHRNRKLARIVIDEAHCVSEWGHDFRPDYKELGAFRKKFPGVPVMALTATANRTVKLDVMNNLGMKGCPEFSQSFNRPNLTYEIRPKGKKADVMDSIASLIREKYPKKSGIIYALSRKTCEDIAKQLSSQYSIKAAHYHAQLDANKKRDVQKKWQAGTYQVIVATIAFGMGIDKADVRFVIHHSVPKSMEGYYQETGRAGRDGKKSGCYLYYGYQDTTILRKFIDDGEGNNLQKERQRSMLNAIVQFCENKFECRRVEILNYFNETFRKEDCNSTCDNCISGTVFEIKDFTQESRNAIKVLQQISHDGVTIQQCSEVLRGAKNAKITQTGHANIEGYGSISHLHRGEIERLLRYLVCEGVVNEYSVINRANFAVEYIEVGNNSHDILQGRRRIKMKVALTSGALFKGTNTRNREASPAKKKARIAPSQTGVAAARNAYQVPASTNVSSPVHGPKRQRQLQGRIINDEAEEAGENEDVVYSHEYARDGFVVSDNDIDSDDGEFAPIRDVRSRSKKSRELGAPISRDKHLAEANLTPIHQDVLHEFVHEGKSLDEQIRNERGLKKPIFTERQLREMCINWTLSVDEILQIDGVREDQVRIFGPRFVKLIAKCYESYDSMMNNDDRDMDANHRNVVEVIEVHGSSEVSGDDEYQSEDEDQQEVETEDGDDDFDEDDEPAQNRSRFFPPAEVPYHVRQFNELKRQSQQTSEPPPRAQSRARSAAPRRKGGFHKKKAFGRKRQSGGVESAAESGSTRPAKRRSTGGAKNRNSYGSTASGSTTAGRVRGGGSSRGGGAATAPRGGGSGGFGATPHGGSSAGDGGGPGNIMAAFGRTPSGFGGGGGSGGFRPMPH